MFNQKSWFWGYSYQRDPGAIGELWDMFEMACSDSPLQSRKFHDAFDRACKISGPVYVTMGLFWIRPNVFLSLDKINCKYLSIKLPRPLTFERYFEIISDVVTRNESFPRLSRNAWLKSQKKEIALPPDGVHEPEAPTLEPSSKTVQRPELRIVLENFTRAKIPFPPPLIEDLHLGLWAHPIRHFAVLTGLSGSGKTLLATKYGEVLTDGTQEHLQIVPVQPGWHDPAPLLGYLNPLHDDRYERTQFLSLLIHAVEHPAEPHVVVLDEMNLSHPEQYLAPLLSAMETKGWLPLHEKDNEISGVPRRICYPSNLVLIGTVNMDETTLGLSDKVLDRAHTIEFWDIKVEDWPHWNNCGLSSDAESTTKTVLIALMNALKPPRLHFGWRVIETVVDYLRVYEKECKTTDVSEGLDRILSAKVLPKMRGENSKLFRAALEDCHTVLEGHKLQRCTRKIEELRNDLERVGSAQYWR